MVGLRLDKALSLDVDIASRSRAEHLISANLVTVNERIEKPSYRVKPKDKIVVELINVNHTSDKLIPLDLKIPVIYEDDDLLVIDKPSGLVVHPAAGHKQDTLVNALLNHSKELSMKFGEQRPGIVHRIDKDTSGLLVIAKNDFSHEKLAQQFKNKTAHRVYFALCLGDFRERTGKIQSYLARHPTQRKKFASVRDSKKKIIRTKSVLVKNGKWSVTNYQAVESIHGLTYLKLVLETGRTHQIRVHLSEFGHPIVADPIYGSEKMTAKLNSKIAKNAFDKINRLVLHAAELGFQHPRTGEVLLFKTSWPAETLACLKGLGFHDV